MDIAIIPSRLQVLLFVVSVLFAGYLVYLVRREIIELKYILLWLLIASIMFGMTIYPQSLLSITGWLGIELAVNALFLVGLLFALLLILTLTIVVSKLRYSITKLTQEIGLLKLELSDIKGKQREHHHTLTEEMNALSG